MSQPLKVAVVVVVLAFLSAYCGGNTDRCARVSCPQAQTCAPEDGQCKPATGCAPACEGTAPVCAQDGTCAQCTQDMHCSTHCDPATRRCELSSDGGAPGDTCAAPAQLSFESSDTVSFTVDTRAYESNFAAECAPSSVRGGDSVHRITLSTESDVSIRATGGISGEFIAEPVLTLRGQATDGGEACEHGVLLGCSGLANPPDGGAALQKLDFAHLPAGDYFLVVDTANLHPGPIDVTVRRSAATPVPSNDSCAEASPLVFDGAAKASVSGSTFGATNGTGPEDDTPTCNPRAKESGPDVVYTYTLTHRRDVLIQLTAAPDFGAVLYARKGSCASGAFADQLGCTGNGTPGSRTLRLANQAPGTYWLTVDTGSSTGGAFQLDVSLSQPTNDDCDVALPLAFVADVASVEGNTSTASHHNFSEDGGVPRSPDCSAPARNTAADLVYSYALASPQDVQITVTPSPDAGFQPVVYVKRPNSCGSDLLSDQLACSVTSNPRSPNRFSLFNQAAGTYFLWVDGASAATGPFSLEVQLSPPTALPANDSCGGAETVTFDADGGSRFEIDTRRATSQYVGSCNTSRVNSNELVYRIPLATAKDLRIEAKETGDAGVVDPVIYLRTGNCESGTELACNDSNRGTPDVINRLNLPAGDYYLFVESYGTAGAGPTTVTVTTGGPTVTP